MARGSRHPMNPTPHAERTRRRVAQEAARLMSEHGIRDYGHAKSKAAERLGIGDARQLPRNSEVEDALREHQRLFHADRHENVLRALRETACEALAFLAPFHPRLVGPVLAGTADDHSAVCLQLFSDTPEAVQVFLDEHGIPFTTTTRRVRLRRAQQADMPVLQFAAGTTAIDLTVLPLLARREAPLDKIDEQPMARASLADVRAMLAHDTDVQPAGPATR